MSPSTPSRPLSDQYPKFFEKVSTHRFPFLISYGHTLPLLTCMGSICKVPARSTMYKHVYTPMTALHSSEFRAPAVSMGQSSWGRWRLVPRCDDTSHLIQNTFLPSLSLVAASRSMLPREHVLATLLFPTQLD